MRPVVLAAMLPLFAACQTAPAPAPLPVLATFPVTYTGRIAPCTPKPTAADASTQKAIPEVGATTFFKVTVVELPREHARSWLPMAAATPTPAPAGTAAAAPHVPGAAGGGAVIPIESPAMATLGVVVSGETLHAALQDARCERFAEAPQVAVGMDATGSVTTEDQWAFVHAMDLKALGSSQLVGDPQVADFAFGQRYEFRPHRDGDNLRIEFGWHTAEPITPVPVVKTRYASLQVPLLVEHHITGTATVTPGQVLLVGTLPGRDDEHVRLLCVGVSYEANRR